jgi:hypothetical protein
MSALVSLCPKDETELGVQSDGNDAVIRPGRQGCEFGARTACRETNNSPNEKAGRPACFETKESGRRLLERGGVSWRRRGIKSKGKRYEKDIA